MIGTVLILAGMLSAALALNPPWRRIMPPIALAALLLATCWLASRFVLDDFSYHQVWLQSDPNLDWWLKLAGLWSGDEGTLLLLAVLSALLLTRLARSGTGATAGAALLTIAFSTGALVWNPFAATSAADLASAPWRGMNAHLTSVWVLVHPPLIFASYLVVIAPAGAMVSAIATGDPAWRDISTRYARIGWLLISAGIGFGMWWAYEDFTYGTLWHWDPVQTALFAAWCYLTAMLHLQTRYRPEGAIAVWHPLLGLLAAASAMTAMAVTRSEQLASSHRYVGNTSLPLLAAIAGAILVALVAALVWRAFNRPPSATARIRVPAMLWLAALLLALFGLAAHFQLARAYWGAYHGLPRPDDLKPFFETLRNFGSAGELAALRQAFAQWDVDNFALNRWLAPVMLVTGLVGGHYLLPLPRRLRWVLTGLAIAAVSATVFWLKPFEHIFEGRGMTSGKTVAMFPALDATLAAVAWLLIAASLAMIQRLRRRASPVSAPVGLLHAGVMLALIGGLSATVFDSYTQQFVELPATIGDEIRFAGGYAVTINTLREADSDDGARGAADNSAFSTIGHVSWSLRRDGTTLAGGDGHTVYRDTRNELERGTGAVRLMCETIDYRFARYRSADRQMIHPLISRGLLQDVQIWLPAAIPDPQALDEPRKVPVVLKTFPLISLVWIGLVLCLAGAVWQTARQFTPAPPPA